MNYKNAKDVLPANLIKEIQKYSSGEILYIPKKEQLRAGWGENSGTRKELYNRNIKIREDYMRGISVDKLMSTYCLSKSSIHKIIYSRKSEYDFEVIISY